MFHVPTDGTYKYIASGRRVRLREARERAHLSREHLARLSDCSTSRVQQFEHGLRPDVSPTLKRVWAVLDALLGDEPRREEVTPKDNP